MATPLSNSLMNIHIVGRYSPNAVSSSEFCSSSSSYYYDDRDYSATPTTSVIGNQEDDVTGQEIDW